MRLYHPQVTRPLPPNAQVDANSGTVKFITKRGPREGILTAKRRVRYNCSSWYLDFANHVGERIKFKAFEDKKASMLLGCQIDKLILALKAGLPPPQDVQRWAASIEPTMQKKLTRYGLLPKGTLGWNTRAPKVRGAIRQRPVRYLRPGEFLDLLNATLIGPERFGMSGEERWLLYQFGQDTGINCNDIRCIKIRQVDFTRRILLYVEAQSKSLIRVNLSYELADLLRRHSANKLPNMNLFGGRYQQLTDRTGLMLQRDCETADIGTAESEGQIRAFASLRPFDPANAGGQKLTRDWLHHGDQLEHYRKGLPCCGACSIPIPGYYRRVTIWDIWWACVSELDLGPNEIQSIRRYSKSYGTGLIVGVCSAECEARMREWASLEIERSVKSWLTELGVVNQVKIVYHRLTNLIQQRSKETSPIWLMDCAHAEKTSSSSSQACVTAS